jgi:hypothetical protein
MNLEDVESRNPMDAFSRLEDEVALHGGRIVETEVIGLVPDRLVTSAAEARLSLSLAAGERLLSKRIRDHLAASLSHSTVEGAVRS